MSTSKPISTISYNTKDFLLAKLNSWYESHLIQAYQVIFHLGEEGDKNHAHVRIEPNKVLDPMNLTAELKEPDPHHNKERHRIFQLQFYKHLTHFRAYCTHFSILHNQNDTRHY